MRLRPTGLTALAACLLVLAATAEAVDFKGIELGQPLWISQERAVFGTLDCNPLQLDAEEYRLYVEKLQQEFPGVRKICSGRTSIATVPAAVTVLLGASRRVLRLTLEFAAEEYPRIRNAMSTKWGDGVEEVRDEADQSIWWDFDDGSSISVHRVPASANGDNRGAEARLGLAEYSLPAASPAGDL